MKCSEVNMQRSTEAWAELSADEQGMLSQVRAVIARIVSVARLMERREAEQHMAEVIESFTEPMMEVSTEFANFTARHIAAEVRRRLSQ
jgi:hypothetical protein